MKFRGKITRYNADLVKDRSISYYENDQGEWEWNFGVTILEDSKDILRDLVAGLSQREIAEKYGLSQPTIARRKAKFIQLGYLTEDLELTEAVQQWLDG